MAIPHIYLFETYLNYGKFTKTSLFLYVHKGVIIISEGDERNQEPSEIVQI